MSKAIYQPQGKAHEYSLWACNLYVGCSNDCSYCYCKRGVLGAVMGKPKATLKKCFKDENDAFLTFQKELMRYRERIIADGGLFFSFSTDPCLQETIKLTKMCVAHAAGEGVPCRILTKRADWILGLGREEWEFLRQVRTKVTIGFTLTGRDENETGASTNRERIAAIRLLSDAGFRTFASVEPIIDFDRAIEMVEKASPWCDEYRFGLLSGDRSAYDGIDLHQSIVRFIDRVLEIVPESSKLFWKRSIRREIEKQDPMMAQYPCKVIMLDLQEYAKHFLKNKEI